MLIAGYKPMFNYLSVRLRTPDMPRTLEALEAEWKHILPAHPFNYFFVDADYARQYHEEERLAQLTSLFAGLAILLACLGLFGLAAYAAERRTREIGIRKVLGASVTQALLLLTAEFVKLGLRALLIATPIAYLAAHRWLADFAYRIDLGWEPFVLAGGLVLLLATLAVSYRSIRAALADPVHTLRYE